MRLITREYYGTLSAFLPLSRKCPGWRRNSTSVTPQCSTTTYNELPLAHALVNGAVAACTKTNDRQYRCVAETMTFTTYIYTIVIMSRKVGNSIIFTLHVSGAHAHNTSSPDKYIYILFLFFFLAPTLGVLVHFDCSSCIQLPTTCTTVWQIGNGWLRLYCQCIVALLMIFACTFTLLHNARTFRQLHPTSFWTINGHT